MTVFDPIFEFLTANPLTTFNTLLLILTAYLGYSSFIFQNRTSVRESLEQLGDLELGHDILSPILHKYSYSLFRETETVVLLKYYTAGENPARAVRYRKFFDRTFYRTFRNRSTGDDVSWGREEFTAAFQQHLLNEDFADDVRVADEGIYITLNKDSAVEIRRDIERILDHISRIHTTSGDTWESELAELPPESED